MCASQSSVRLVLDAGVDEHDCPSGVCLDERGLRFISHWHFSLGTQLAIRCRYHHPQRGWLAVALEGIVVWSERAPEIAGALPSYDTTVLFLELPEELRAGVREFSHHLVV
jgi:hypothetical protein